MADKRNDSASFAEDELGFGDESLSASGDQLETLSSKVICDSEVWREGRPSALKFGPLPESFPNLELLGEPMRATSPLAPSSLDAIASPDIKINDRVDRAGDATDESTRITTDAKGNITKVILADGRWRQFDRTADGAIVKITESGGVTFVSTDGLNFHMLDSKDVFTGTVTVARDGSYSFDNGETKLTRRPSGELVGYGKDGNVTSRTSADGIYIGYDRQGRVQEVVGADGTLRRFAWQADVLTGVTDSSGATFVSADGLHWNRVGTNLKEGKTQRLGSYSIDSSGNLKFTSSDNQSRVEKLDGSMVQSDRQGRPVQVRDAKGGIYNIVYGEGGSPKAISYPDGDMRTLTRGIWTSSKTGKTWAGSITVDGDGTISEVGADKTERALKTDGWTRLKDGHGLRFERSEPNGAVIIKNADEKIVGTVDAAGNKTDYKYDRTGKLVAITDANGSLTTTDGAVWTRQPGGGKESLLVTIGEDGSLSTTNIDSAAIKVRMLDGSSVTRDASDRVVETVTPGGLTRKFAYDALGRVNRITGPEPGTHWTSKDGTSWRMKGSVESTRAQIEVHRDGTMISLDLKTKTRTILSADGTVLQFDKAGKPLLEQKSDGTYTLRQYGRDGKQVGLEQKLADGTIINANEKNQIIKVRTAAGVVRRFGYDSEGKINFYSQQNEIWRKEGPNRWFKDGAATKVPWIGEMGVSAGGDFLTKDHRTSEQQVHHSDGSRLVTTDAPKETSRTYDPAGRLTVTVDYAGKRREFAYDAAGTLNRIVEQNPESGTLKTWLTSDGKSWHSPDGKETFSGSIRLSHTDGTLSSLETKTGRHRIERLESAAIVITREKTTANARAIHAAIHPAPSRDISVSPTGVEAVDKTLSLAIRPLLVPMDVADVAAKDPKAIENILANLSEPEREALKAEYKKLYNVELAADIKQLNTTADSERALNALNHKDTGLPDYAGIIHASLTEMSSFVPFLSRTSSTCQQEIRDVISRLNKDQIDQLSADYKRRYNVSLEDALLKSSNISTVNKSALSILLEGTDYLAKDANYKSTLRLAELALKDKNMALFKDAFRAASPKAREEFFSAGGQKRMQEVFGGHWYSVCAYAHPVLLTAALASGTNIKITDTNYRHAMDYAKYGKLSAATQVTDNTSWLGDSEQATEQALSSMGEAERQLYSIGKARSEKSSLAELQERFPAAAALVDPEGRDQFLKEADAYYKKLHGALEYSAGIWFSPTRKASELARWEDLAAVKGGSLISRLSEHGGWLYNGTNQAIFSDIENMTESEWKYLKNLPEAQQAQKISELRALLTSIAAGDVLARDNKFVDRAMTLIETKIKAKNYAESREVGRRTVLETLKDNVNWYGNDYEPLVAALEHMPAEERQKYYGSGTDYKERLDAAVKAALPDGPARELLLNMLARGSKDLAPTMDPLDKLNLRILQDQQQRQWIAAGAGAIEATVAPFSPMRKPGDGNMQDALQAAGLVMSYPAESIRDLSELFERNKQAYADFKKRYDSEPAYKRSFDAAAHKLFPKAEDFERYVKPLVQKGRLDPEVRAQLNQGLIRDNNAGFQKDFSGLSEQDRKRLLEDEEAAEIAFRNLSQPEREVARNIIRQGKQQPEDMARAYVLGFGTSQPELMAAWKNLSEEQREEAITAYADKYKSSIHADLRSALGATEAEDILDRAGTPEEAIARILDRYYRSYDGVGKTLVDTFWNGTGYQARNEADQLVALQALASSEFKRIKDSKEFRDSVDNLIGALKNFRESKEATAQAVADAVIALAAVAGSFFTGGTSLGLLAGTAIAGAILKVTIKAGIMGSDYNFSKDALLDAVTGALDAGLNLLGPGEIAAMARLGETAGKAAVKATVTEVGSLLATGAEEVLEREMVSMVRHSLATGARELPEKALEQLAKKVVREGTEEAGEAAAKQVAQTLRSQMEAQLKAQMGNGLKQLAREYLLVMSSGAIAGGVTGSVHGVAHWDPNLTPAENLQRVAMSGGSSAAFGAAGAGGFHTAFKVGGAAIRAGKNALGRKTAGAAPEVHVDGPEPHTSSPDGIPVETTPATIDAPRTPADKTPSAASPDGIAGDTTPATIDAPRTPSDKTPSASSPDGIAGDTTPATIDAPRTPSAEAPSAPAVEAPVDRVSAAVPADAPSGKPQTASDTPSSDALRAPAADGPAPAVSDGPAATADTQTTAKDKTGPAEAKDAGATEGKGKKNSTPKDLLKKVPVANTPEKGFPDATAEQLLRRRDDLHAALVERGIDPLDTLYWDEISDRLTDMVAHPRNLDTPRFVGEHAQYITDLARAVREGRLTTASQIDELLLTLQFNLDNPGNSVSLNAHWDAFVRSADAGRNVDGWRRWLESAPNRRELPNFGSTVGNPPQFKHLGMPGWKMDGIDIDGKIVLRHNGEVRISPSDLNNPAVRSNFEPVGTQANPDGTITVRARDHVRAHGADGQPVDMVVRVRPEEVLMSTMQANGFDNDCVYAVSAFLKNASHEGGLAGALRDGNFSTPKSVEASIGNRGNINHDQFLGIVQGQSGMRAQAVNPPTLQNAPAGVYVAVARGATHGNHTVDHTFLVIVDSAGNKRMLDVSHGKVRPIEDSTLLASLHKMQGPDADRAARNLGLDDAGQPVAAAQSRPTKPGSKDTDSAIGKSSRTSAEQAGHDLRRSNSAGQEQVSTELSQIKSSADGKSVLDKLQESPLTDAQKKRVLSALSAVRERFVGQRSTDGTLDLDQQINWIHTQGELGRVLDAAVANDLTPHQIEDALLASMFSDAVKSKSNFFTHHLDGAQNARQVLSSMTDKEFSAARIEGIFHAIREHQIGPPEFMSKVYASKIRSKLMDSQALIGTAQEEAIQSIQSKLADPLNAKWATHTTADGGTAITFSPEERKLLALIGTEQWYVPQAANPWNSISRALIDGDSLDNYFTAGGYSKIVALGGPESDQWFKTARLDNEWRRPGRDTNLGSVRSSAESARTVLTEKSKQIADQATAATEDAVGAAKLRVQEWLIAHGVDPDADVPFWNSDLKYPQRPTAEAENEWWRIHRLPPGKRTANELSFYNEHRFDGLSQKETQDFLLAMEIRERMVAELRRAQRMAGDDPPVYKPVKAPSDKPM